MNCIPVFKKVVKASRVLNSLDAGTFNKVLLLVADAAVKNTDYIISENRKDLERMNESDPRYDRLKLTKARIEGIAGDIKKVAELPSPLGRIISEATMPNGLKISRLLFPLV
jgi:glutamate-5-semialdehyde dehydrogenase